MYHHMYGDGWSWLWAIPMMLVWIVVLGAVVYGAVRFALQHQDQQKPPLQQ